MTDTDGAGCSERPWLEAYARFVLRRRWLVIAAVALVTIGLGGAIGRLQLVVDPDDQLPQEHPFIIALNEVHRVFGDKNLVVVGLVPRSGTVYEPEFLRTVAEITEEIAALPGANRRLVQSLAAPHIKAIRGTEEGMEVERVLAAPPDDLAGALLVRERVESNPIFVDTLVSADGSAAAIHASFELSEEMPGYGQLETALRGVLDARLDGSFDYHLSGVAIFLSQLNRYTARIAFTFPIAILVIGLVHYHAFRTLQALFLPLLTALLSVVWALGLMGALGVALDPFNMTTPVLILAVAAGHAVQILKRFYEEYQHVDDVDEAIVRSLIHVGPVMICAGIVAALSFSSLITFQTATIRTFGLFTAFGILAALTIEMTVIPAVRAVLPAPGGRERERESLRNPWIDRLLSLPADWAASARKSRRVIAASGLLLLACAGLTTRVGVDMSLKRQFRADDPVRVDDALLNEKLAGTNTLILTVEGPTPGSLQEPEALRAIDQIERALEAEPGVGKASSYVDFIARMHEAMNADRGDAGRLPDSRNLAAQYLFLYTLSGGADDFDSIIDPSYTIAKVRFLVHEDSTRYGSRLIDRARDLVAQHMPDRYAVRYTGTLASTAAATQVMVDGKVRNIGQIALITWLVAAVLLGSLIGGALVIVPLALAVGVNFGVMGLLGIPLDSFTSAISAMAVGIGADYAMYTLFRMREELTMGRSLPEAISVALATSGKAVVFVSTAIAAGYATLCLSGFGIHIRLGSMVALAMVTSSAAALVILPAIVTLGRPLFLIRQMAPAIARQSIEEDASTEEVDRVA